MRWSVWAAAYTSAFEYRALSETNAHTTLTSSLAAIIKINYQYSMKILSLVIIYSKFHCHFFCHWHCSGGKICAIIISLLPISCISNNKYFSLYHASEGRYPFLSLIWCNQMGGHGLFSYWQYSITFRTHFYVGTICFGLLPCNS